MSALLKTLKFVKGAVAKKDLRPELKYFRICDNIITGSNGVIELRSSINVDLDICPDAQQFIKAIEQCDDTVVLSMTESGRLSVKCGKFRSLIQCLPKELYPNFNYEQYQWFQFPVLQAIKTLQPFIGEDASRQWSRGILFRNGSCYATNNITLIQYDLQALIPTIVIPDTIITEIVRINEEPWYIGVGEHSVQFYYEDGRCITGLLLQSNDWPNADKLFDREAQFEVIPEELFVIINKLLPFTDNLHTLYFNSEHSRIGTEKDDYEGTHYNDCYFVNFDGCYNARLFALLKPICKWADFHQTPAIFYGDRVRGVIVGMNR